MNLEKFPGHNVVFAENQPEYLPLPAHIDRADPQGCTTFCWRLTLRERIKLLFTGRLWHQVLTFRSPLQPQLLHVERPEFAHGHSMSTDAPIGAHA